MPRGRPRKNPLPETNIEKVESESKYVQLEIIIPKEVFSHYLQIAENQDIDIDEAIAARLQTCLSHNDIRSLYFTDSERSALENILRKNPITSAEQALSLLRNMFSVQIGAFSPIAISAAAAKRLALQDGFGGLSSQQHLEQTVKNALVKRIGTS